jgi:hypothetical protein
MFNKIKYQLKYDKVNIKQFYKPNIEKNRINPIVLDKKKYEVYLILIK